MSVSWQDQYAAALRDYVVQADEASLEQAYELGRQMLGDERAMLDLVEVYHQELAALVRAARTPDDCERTIARTRAFFSESLSPFAMAQRGFRDAIARLRDLHQLLREPHEATDFIVTVLEASTEYSIIGKDLGGTIVLWNEGARRIYGYEPADVVGKASSAMLHTPEDVARGTPREIMDLALRDGKWEGTVSRVRQSGERFVARLVITPRRDAAGTPIGFLLMSKDISDEIRLTEELERKNEELEEQYRHVQEANRLKSEFLANMSHELRTPLNAIIGFTELMYDGKVGPVSDLHQEYLGDVLTSSRHLLQIINDILDLSKVEAGKIEFRPEEVNIAQLVGEVRDIVRTLAATKLVHIAVEIDAALTTVVADPARLKQILYNYLSNAIKFTPEHGRITIRVAPDAADYLRLEVEDTGIGIRPHDMERLFLEFQQLDASASKKYQGTGLGLALTKRIVEAQGGRVGASSTPGQGSVFFAVLPRVAAPSHGLRLCSAAAGPGALLPRARDDVRRRILVVEDDHRSQQWLVQVLANAGYAVTVAENGAAALALCREQAFDAVTLDLLLPDMDGGDVLHALRTQERNRDVPVIVVTVVADQGCVAGFPIDDFLIKPVAAQDLLGALERAGIPSEGRSTVLVVEKDASMRKLMEVALSRRGYRPICVADGESGLRAVVDERPAAVILDLAPGMEPFQFLRRLRATVPGRSVTVLVWMSEELTPQGRAQLEASAEAVVLKSQSGTAALLEELAECLSASDGHAGRATVPGGQPVKEVDIR